MVQTARIQQHIITETSPFWFWNDCSTAAHPDVYATHGPQHRSHGRVTFTGCPSQWQHKHNPTALFSLSTSNHTQVQHRNEQRHDLDTRKRTVNTPVAVEYDATVVAHDMDKLAAFEHWVAQAVAPGLPDTVESHHTPAAACANNVCTQGLK